MRLSPLLRRARAPYRRRSRALGRYRRAAQSIATQLQRSDVFGEIALRVVVTDAQLAEYAKTDLHTADRFDGQSRIRRCGGCEFLCNIIYQRCFDHGHCAFVRSGDTHQDLRIQGGDRRLLRRATRIIHGRFLAIAVGGGAGSSTKTIAA